MWENEIEPMIKFEPSEILMNVNTSIDIGIERNSFQPPTTHQESNHKINVLGFEIYWFQYASLHLIPVYVIIFCAWLFLVLP